ncbi:MAG: Trm112 family protein [Armatimonadota bacterium]
MVDERLLEILVCPRCKQDVRLEDDGLVCDECCLKYPIRNGIPIMLIEDAEPLEECEDEE